VMLPTILLVTYKSSGREFFNFRTADVSFDQDKLTQTTCKAA
jgi:hypothetical protein